MFEYYFAVSENNPKLKNTAFFGHRYHEFAARTSCE